MSRGCESYPCDENCEKYSHMCVISVRLVSLKEKYMTLHKWRLYDFSFSFPLNEYRVCFIAKSCRGVRMTNNCHPLIVPTLRISGSIHSLIYIYIYIYIYLYIYLFIYLFIYSSFSMGQDSSVGIATGRPGDQSRWGRDLPHPFRPALGPT